MRYAFTLDPQSATPLHRQIYDEWRQGILSGRFRPGERLPSTRDLARTLTVARTTVTSAYDQLIGEGYLQSSHGSGTFVCRELPEELLRARRGPALRATLRATSGTTLRAAPETAIRLAKGTVE